MFFKPNRRRLDPEDLPHMSTRELRTYAARELATNDDEESLDVADWVLDEVRIRFGRQERAVKRKRNVPEQDSGRDRPEKRGDGRRPDKGRGDRRPDKGRGDGNRPERGGDRRPNGDGGPRTFRPERDEGSDDRSVPVVVLDDRSA